MIDTSLSLDSHLNYIGKKIGFITHKLTPLRFLKDTKLNINLFKILIMPQFRMSFGIIDYLSNGKTKDFMKLIKCKFKFFCLLPRTTPDALI